jgi:hypothetical protein
MIGQKTASKKRKKPGSCWILIVLLMGLSFKALGVALFKIAEEAGEPLFGTSQSGSHKERKRKKATKIEAIGYVTPDNIDGALSRKKTESDGGNEKKRKQNYSRVFGAPEVVLVLSLSAWHSKPAVPRKQFCVLNGLLQSLFNSRYEIACPAKSLVASKPH